MRKFFAKLVAALLGVSCAFLLFGCDFGGGQQNTPNGGVTLVTTLVNYHYEYNVVIENYWRETYTLEKDTEREITQFYVPPYKLGYRFLGWTRSEGGEGEVISSLTIKGTGGMGTVYNLYAKYEQIEYTVKYHLNGGTNSSKNPEEGTPLTGKHTLYNAAPREGYEFGGWYLDEHFGELALRIELSDNEQTEVNLYAKWNEVFKISYVINIDGEDKDGMAFPANQNDWVEHRLNSYTEGFLLDLQINLPAGITFPQYLFVGWTYEGQDKPTFDEEKLSVTLPVGTTGDKVFTANYKMPTNLEAAGVTLKKYYNDDNESVIELTVPDGVDEVVLSDDASKHFAHTIIVKYSGEKQPKVYVSHYVSEIIYETAMDCEGV